ncbi:MAG: hypothetical protein KBC84_04530 [Proteobacteria bacterium]|nr:hypothetical protein [Pseudomonadota bacterium]
MSLINQINGSLLRTLSGSGSSSTSGNSSINGNGVGASFGGDTVDVSAGLSVLASAFKSSALRLNTPFVIVSRVKSTLGEINDITDQLLELSEKAASSDTSLDERGNLNNRFQALVNKYNNLVDNTKIEVDGTSFDLLNKTNLKTLLADSGIELSTTKDLGQAFNTLASDGQLGYSDIASEDLYLVNGDGSVEFASALSTTDPLSQNLQTRAGATIAVTTLTQLKEDVSKDLKNISKIADELRLADNFAINANTAVIDLLNRADTGKSPEDIASLLVQKIKQISSDNKLAAHSDIDKNLALELLA